MLDKLLLLYGRSHRDDDFAFEVGALHLDLAVDGHLFAHVRDLDRAAQGDLVLGVHLDDKCVVEVEVRGFAQAEDILVQVVEPLRLANDLDLHLQRHAQRLDVAVLDLKVFFFDLAGKRPAEVDFLLVDDQKVLDLAENLIFGLLHLPLAYRSLLRSVFFFAFFCLIGWYRPRTPGLAAAQQAGRVPALPDGSLRWGLCCRPAASFDLLGRSSLVYNLSGNLLKPDLSDRSN